MKKAVIIGMFLVAACGLLLSQATTGRGKLTGKVVSAETGEPLEGVSVKLYSVRARSYHNVVPKTDKDGEWRALYLRGGAWHIDFEKVGYETKKISVGVDTRPGSKVPNIQIELRKVEGPALEDVVVKEIEAARELMAESRLDEALQKFEDIMQKYEESGGIDIVNLYIGNAYALKDEYEKAIDAYKKAAEKYPKNRELIISIGNAYNNLNRYEAAMEWFSKIPFEEIDNVDTLYNIGVIYYNQARYDEAVKYFQRTTQINSEFADGYYQLGMTYTALNKIPEAVENLKKFMELDPESPDFETAKAIVEAFSQQQ